MWNWMTGNQKFLLLVLFFTTFFGAFVYLCYLGIAYRMERSSPVLGPQILQREAAAAAKAARQVAPAKAALMVAGGLLTGAAGVFVLALISVAVDDHRSKPALTSQVTHAAVVSDGCDLAGAVPNCKEVLATRKAMAPH